MNLHEFKRIILEYHREINENVNTAFRFLGVNYGLTMLQFRLLMEIYRQGPHTIGSLAEACGIAGANISTMCKKLEKQGFVRRMRDQTDERVVRIRLTDFGEGTIREIDRYLNDKLTRILANEAEETFEMITAGMGKISSLLLKMGSDDEGEAGETP
ncbi:MarR family transcriptional regulator [Neobacillus sp. OS1-32]|uniref:MarR family winged helix-turn-helix transcriptional regulator n=1 Tax=Neobacillus sp. OS1-32 TaxID=3070682 RepID=UPI0027E088A6|nr:MarR family transcriptional regulator [Neobacillus sp. OS1-32]WML29951.1 MarR family transcriptional regulator [Neobacillus sp. OS1-32]